VLLEVLENMVLRRMFVSRRDKVTGGRGIYVKLRLLAVGI
jgi:hypothetical protein